MAHLRTGGDAAPVREYAAGLAAEGGMVLLPKRPCFPCPPPRCARWRQRAGRWTALLRKRGGVHCAAPSLYARGRGGLTRPAAGHLKRTLRPGRCGRESKGDLIFDFRGPRRNALQRKNLSPKRYEHTCNVRKLAVKLAKAHSADEKSSAGRAAARYRKGAAAGQIIADIYRKCYNSW